MSLCASIWTGPKDAAHVHLQVTEQVEHVALAVKQGSEISDLRRHTFSAAALRVRLCPPHHPYSIHTTKLCCIMALHL